MEKDFNRFVPPLASSSKIFFNMSIYPDHLIVSDIEFPLLASFTLSP